MSYDKIYKDNIVSGASIRDGKGNRIDTMYLSKDEFNTFNPANTNLSNITEEGIQVIKDNSGSGLENKITNCLLEVPQRIKLELNDGTLTLKAGSQVIVPNGFEADGTTPRFDYVTVANDISETSTLNTTCMVSLCTDDNTLIFRLVANYQSGTQSDSSQANNSNYYYTDSNLVKDKTSSGTIRGSSLPIAIVNVSSTQITSIDQVFNGMGYIGSTVWVDKGVKGLIPNGRNEDGSLRNVEFTTQNILLRNNTERGSAYLVIVDGGTSVSIAFKEVWVFDEKSNRILNGGVIRDNIGFYGDITLGTGGVITSFTPKLPFRAVDWSDIDSVIPTGTIVAFASTTTPTGFLYCNGANISRTAYAKLFNIIGTTYGTGDGSTTYALPNLSTAQFVTSSTASVYGNGKGLVLSNGSVEYGIQNDCDRSECAWGKSSTNIGASIGAASNRDTALLKTIFGVTTNPTKSGLTSKLSTTTLRWYIKY